MTDVVVHTGSSPARTSVVSVTMLWPPAVRTLVTVVCAVTSSPAMAGRWCSNACSPCTRRVKSMPASGSTIAAASPCCATLTRNVGGATTSA
nr:hypothetical protein [Barrientosiimonas endolithica]